MISVAEDKDHARDHARNDARDHNNQQLFLESVLNDSEHTKQRIVGRLDTCLLSRELLMQEIFEYLPPHLIRWYSANNSEIARHEKELADSNVEIAKERAKLVDHMVEGRRLGKGVV